MFLTWSGIHFRIFNCSRRRTMRVCLQVFVMMLSGLWILVVGSSRLKFCNIIAVVGEQFCIWIPHFLVFEIQVRRLVLSWRVPGLYLFVYFDFAVRTFQFEFYIKIKLHCIIFRIHAFVRWCGRAFVRLCVRVSVCSCVHTIVRSCVRTFVRLFVHWFVCSCSLIFFCIPWFIRALVPCFLGVLLIDLFNYLL